jgi:hypothetical protein
VYPASTLPLIVGVCWAIWAALLSPNTLSRAIETPDRFVRLLLYPLAVLYTVEQMADGIAN